MTQYDISENDLKLVRDILNRNCDDDIWSNVRTALDAVSDAIVTMQNREYTNAREDYIREVLIEASR